MGVKDKDISNMAQQVLQSRKDKNAFAFIKKALGDENQFVRRKAIEALYGRTDKKSLALIEKAFGDSDYEVRCRAAQAIMSRNEDILPKPFIQKLLSNNDIEPKLLAIALLGGKEDPVSLSFLQGQTKNRNFSLLIRNKNILPMPFIRKLLSSNDIELKLLAIITLGEIEDPVSLKLLQKQSKSKNYFSRIVAKRALRKRAVSSSTLPIKFVEEECRTFFKQLH